MIERKNSNRIKTYTHEEWLDEAERRFGDDPRDWQFVCPRCKTAQSAWDFYEAEVKRGNIEGCLAFSCIGRFTDKKGCDWTLGGLFHIHAVEVAFNGKSRMTFDFAETDEARSVDEDSLLDEPEEEEKP